jgi:TatD DNase family protein
VARRGQLGPRIRSNHAKAIGRIGAGLRRRYSMFIDSHCHIDFPEFADDLEGLQSRMQENAVTHALCISINRADFPRVTQLADRFPNIWASAGVHPDHEVGTAGSEDLEIDCAELVQMAQHRKVVAIGETGLDYYRLTGDLEWQRQRFREHIRAARATSLPLVIHTRSASEDTLRILREEGADAVGGVMHCFTETQAVADAAIELGFMISFSGIVTFKNARDLQSVAKRIPLDRMLIETDSPYLAPIPYRGKVNQPAYVRHVGEYIAALREVPVATIAQATTENFFRLFARVERVATG